MSEEIPPPVQVPQFIGGPMCGAKVYPVGQQPVGEPPDTLHLDGGGVYERLTVVPNWLVDIPFKPQRPIYLWQPIYHNLGLPKPDSGSGAG